MTQKLKAILNASEILTGSGIRKKKGRRVQDDDLGIISNGALVYSVNSVQGVEVPGEIIWIGQTRELPREYQSLPSLDLQGAKAVIPELVDCHTHLVFGGDRSHEFALRCAGTSYEEIAKRGGGILTTIQTTRDRSLEELERDAIERVREMAALGVGTFEVKSGYGLSKESELKSLKIATRLKEYFPEFRFHRTFLGAHAFPSDCSRDHYLQKILNEMLPAVVEEDLADSCDVFIDRGYYTIEEGRRILEKAKTLGLQVRVHADELENTGATSLAVEMGAMSADHLLRVSPKGIEDLARSETVGVLLPGTAFYLKAEHAPARRLIDAGAAVAISTDFNPGSSMSMHLPAMMTIAALYLGMSRSELLAAVTYNAAKALGLEKTQGSLEKGLDARFTVLPFSKFEEMYYRFAWCPEVGRYERNLKKTQ